ncbi:MAG: hypothetical protein Q8L47_05640 [bacterium]|nr:hypothetical protein [bacterium]
MIKNAILILLLVSVSVAFVAPRPVYAYTVEDLLNLIPNWLSSLYTMAMKVYTASWDKYVQFALKYAIEKFKLKVIDAMNKQMVEWVTGGAGGSPKFIQNWETYLSGAYNVGFYSVGGELREATICDQFKNKLIDSNWKGVSLPVDANSPFRSRMNCTLDTHLGQQGYSREDYQNDFRSGGWSAYKEQLFQPQNTYLGAYFMAQDEATERGYSKQNAAQQQGLAGKGYLPVKRCAIGTADNCLQWEITTPASVFESALNASTKSRFDYIVNADQIVSMALIMADGFANKLIQSGVDGLFNYGKGTDTTQPGYTDGSDCIKDPTSELCQAIADGDISTIPITGQPPGTSCKADSECDTTICAPTADPTVSFCASTVIADGKPCKTSSQCKSRACDAVSFTCTPPRPDGSTCTSDDQCKSMNCVPISEGSTISSCKPYSTTGGQGQLCNPTGNPCDVPTNSCGPDPFDTFIPPRQICIAS